MRGLEHREQVALMRWWSMACRSFGIDEALLFAIPNGGNRDAVTGAMLKAEGVRAGVPDLFLAVPRNEFGGMFIEMKKPKGGRVSRSQTDMLAALSSSGYKTSVCHGCEEAMTCIDEYLRYGE